MTVRSAQPDDFGAVARLLERLGRPAIGPRNRAATIEVYNAQLDDPDAAHMVAVTPRNRVIGFCSLHFRSRLNHAAPQAWIPDLIVDEGERGRGVARALLVEAEHHARDRGCYELTLESSYTRKEAHLLYVGAGMQDLGKFFRKKLSDD
jgi:GNAT superfamily N-acetyltransferase